jgi:hypothetical protein
MGDDDPTRAELDAEHAALKKQMRALSTAHQCLRRSGSTSAERQRHLMRLRETRLELERHYHRLKRAPRRGRDISVRRAGPGHTPRVH